MATVIRAIYENGQVHLLDDVSLPDGTMLRLIVEQEAHVPLEELIINNPDDYTPDLDEEGMLRLIDSEVYDGPPLSELIIRERDESW